MICFGAAYHYSKVASSEDSEFDEIGQATGPSHAPPGGAPQQSSAHNSEEGQENKLSPMENAIEQEVFGLEMGYGLLVLADKKKGGDLLDRITGARTNFAREMGMLLPTIGVRDNIELEPNEYRFLLRGKETVSYTHLTLPTILLV